jgi:hypothetical protein
MPTWNLDWTWVYPHLKDVLKALGLQRINHYIGAPWEITAHFIGDQPLIALCRDGERKRGSTCCKFWWEQHMSIDIAESLPGDKGDMGNDC